ncbi:MAG: Rrf2 family transcriptional regulator [Clostridiales bacterium]|nr:Rrf2 family transcriptional regulator [Clostridiales bacterium]
MRISAKGRYALAAAIHMAQQFNNGEYITVISISERLGISKIYLEQVFSLLKRGGLVNSVKGSQGGYQLSRMPGRITVLDVLTAVETSLFEQTEDTVREKAPDIETAMRLTAFDVLDKSVQSALGQVTLDDLVTEADKHKGEDALMFYI